MTPRPTYTETREKKDGLHTIGIQYDGPEGSYWSGASMAAQYWDGTKMVDTGQSESDEFLPCALPEIRQAIDDAVTHHRHTGQWPQPPPPPRGTYDAPRRGAGQK